MAYDILKAALEKKKQQHGHGVKGGKSNNKSPGVHSQVTSNKPAKKSAGRGR